MSNPEVGSGQVAIVPTFKGFRRAVNAETEAAGKAADSGFRRVFSKTGEASGKSTGVGFKRAFESSSGGFAAKAQKELTTAVARASKAVSDARLREKDAAGTVRVAETQLKEAREKYARDSSQVVRAEERLEAASRKLARQQEITKGATDTLRTAQGRLADAADDAGDQLEAAGRKSGGRFGTGFKSILGGSFMGTALANFATSATSTISSAIQDGLRAGWDYLKASTDGATQLEQSIGAVDAIFKDNAGAIHEWAKSAATDVGLSQNAFNELSSILGAQLKNLGVPMSDVADKTHDLIGLGADLAAQFGGSTEDAVAALSSLLRGERDPIERYGVSINDARIKAKLAADGLSDLEGEAANAAKTQATLKLLYEQTADAQGTFGRESDTLAGQQQRLNAQWADAQANLGMSLLPALMDLTKVANTDLMPALSDVISKVGPELAAALSDSTPDLIELAKTTADYLPDLIELGVEALPLFIEGLKLLIPVLQFVTDNQSGALTMTRVFLDLMNGGGWEDARDAVDGVGGVLGTVRDILDDVFGKAWAVSQILRGLTSGDVTGALGGVAGILSAGRGDNGAERLGAESLPGVRELGSLAAARANVTQVNHYAHEDPQVAARLAQQQLNTMLRGR